MHLLPATLDHYLDCGYPPVHPRRDLELDQSTRGLHVRHRHLSSSKQGLIDPCIVSAHPEQSDAAQDLHRPAPQAESRKARDSAAREAGGEERQSPAEPKDEGEQHASSRLSFRSCNGEKEKQRRVPTLKTSP